MSINERAYQQAEDQLLEDLADGRISLKEFNAEARAMARDYREEAEAAAQDAYDAELAGW